MSEDEPLALDPELARLLVAERARPGRPRAEIELAYRDVEAALGAAPPPLGPSRFPMGRVAGPAIGLAVGVAIGFAWGHADRPAVAPSATTRPIATLSPAPLAPTSPWTVVPTATVTAAASLSEPTPPTTPAVATDSLPRERALLETARAALARGDAASGLDAIAMHAREFPKGRLAEERDALRVRALVAAGKAAEARAAAEAFRTIHPDSVLQPTVDAALQTLP